MDKFFYICFGYLKIKLVLFGDIFIFIFNQKVIFFLINLKLGQVE